MPEALVRLGMREEARRYLDERFDPALATYAQLRDGDQLVICLALAAAEAWLERVDRAIEVLENACRDLGRIEQPGTTVKVICGYLEVLPHLDWPEQHNRLDSLLAVLPRVPNGFTTNTHYSRLHLQIVDRVVMVIASPRSRVVATEETAAGSELDFRRATLLAARARLVEGAGRIGAR
jgi:hypothetical protein